MYIRMFITYIHIYIESRNTKNTYEFLVQVRNFLLPLSLKVLRHKERDTQYTFFLFWLFHLPPPPSRATPPLPPSSPPSRATPAQGLREQAKANRLLPRQDSTPLTDFFKIPQKSSARFRCATSFALPSPFSHLGLLWNFWVTRPLRACAREHLR